MFESIFCLFLSDVVSPASEDFEVVGVHRILRKQGQYNPFKVKKKSVEYN